MTAVATIDANARPQPAQAPQDNAAARAKDTPKEAEFTFDDLIDVINPLQHLPIVSTIYRAITGDEITPHARAISSMTRVASTKPSPPPPSSRGIVIPRNPASRKASTVDQG